MRSPAYRPTCTLNVNQSSDPESCSWAEQWQPRRPQPRTEYLFQPPPAFCPPRAPGVAFARFPRRPRPPRPASALNPLPSIEAVAGVMDSTEDRPSSLAAEEKGKQPAPYSGAPSPVRAVLNRPWPSPVLIPPDSPSGKHRTLVATTKDIGDPISPEEVAALEDKEGDDDANARFYKAMARTDVFMRNYVHEHGSLYMDENDECVFDNSAQIEEIRCKRVTAEEMETKIMKREVTRQETFLSELALASFNKRRKVKFELCETLLSNSFWQNRDSFVHLNFVAKRKDEKTLLFAEIEECGRVGKQILQVVIIIIVLILLDMAIEKVLTSRGAMPAPSS
ncbi:hypothetical protein D1007_02180 [Hordeum vulgare]|nr:hypothetical protein D1007_02180 [Hordeum vulgare]